MPLLYRPDAGVNNALLLVQPESTADDADIDDLAASLQMVGRNCSTDSPPKVKGIKTFSVKGEFIAFASPDSTYAVTRRLFEQATSEIVIGIYDFSAGYIEKLVLQAMQRGVQVTLMLDVDNQGEVKVMERLAKFGATVAEAPSCANSLNIRYFASCHEKVIIIDNTWCIVQSGNYSENSIPFNEIDGGDPLHFVKGNRDMGVAIKSSQLCRFFAKVIENDMALEAPQNVANLAGVHDFPDLPDLLEAVPAKIPTQLFPSKSITPASPIPVLPVLSPDNYMEVIPGVLAKAKRSIYIENQYIRSNQPHIAKLLAAIKKALDNNPDLDVRIILGKVFSQKDVAKEKANITNITDTYGLELGDNIRYIDTSRFVHCHNKLIIVDEEQVLISSQNWSDFAVTRNREAGLLMNYPELAGYYTSIFESDWSTALKKIPQPGAAVAGLATVATGNFLTVVPADYQEV